MNITKTLTQHAKDPLYKNSFFLMLNSALTTILGFIFITIITRLYTTTDVGFFSAIASVAGLLALFSRLGLDVGLIRFLPASKEPENLINSCFTLSGIVALLFAVIFLAGINLWSPALEFVRDDTNFILLFIAVTILTVVSGLQMNVFVGRRSTEYLVVRDSINNILKIAFVILLAGAGLLGIFSAHGIGIAISFFIALLCIQKVESGYFPKPSIKKGIIGNILHFSIGNYIASLLGMGSILVLPLVVVNVLGAEETAYFYVAWALSNFILVISSSVSTSLFAEGSNDSKRVYTDAKRSLKLTYLLLVPVVLLVLVFGRELLMIFGSGYSQNAYPLLAVLAISSLISSFNVVIYNIKLVEKNIKFIIGYTAISGFGTLLFAYLFAVTAGLIGIGIGRILSQFIAMIFILVVVMRKQSSLKLRSSNTRREHE